MYPHINVRTGITVYSLTSFIINRSHTRKRRGQTTRQKRLAYLEVLLGEGNASAERNLGTDDTVATVEVALLAVHVHGTTLALRATIGPAHQLGQHLL